MAQRADSVHMLRAKNQGSIGGSASGASGASGTMSGSRRRTLSYTAKYEALPAFGAAEGLYGGGGKLKVSVKWGWSCAVCRLARADIRPTDPSTGRSTTTRSGDRIQTKQTS